ncbi:MAG: type VI secretion system tube protein Hcp [Planctomycetes bacterium]|nr:type VI secretion system tube protein Hcp [Planctomycetota bacterium]
MAFDAFIKLDGIPGESTDDKHKEWIEVLSFSHGASQASFGSRSTGGAAGSQRADLTDFSFVKALDKTSPKLFLSCVKGDHIKEVTFHLNRATGDKQKYMEYKMTDVLISGYRPGGSSQSSDLPLEEVSLNFAKIEHIYTETDHKTGKPKGDVKTWWDQSENKGG